MMINNPHYPPMIRQKHKRKLFLDTFWESARNINRTPERKSERMKSKKAELAPVQYDAIEAFDPTSGNAGDDDVDRNPQDENRATRRRSKKNREHDKDSKQDRLPL